MKCPECGVPEDADGARWHAPTCPFAVAPEVPAVARTGTGEPVASAPTEPAPAPVLRVMQFMGHVELSQEGEPVRVTVLISGAPAGVFELGEDGELSIGDAVDLALARAGRRVLSVDAG